MVKVKIFGVIRSTTGFGLLELEAKTVKIVVRVGSNGRMFGTVSTKQVADTIENQLNVKIDKKKFDFNKTIDAIGDYEIPIVLHKEVKATIKVKVVSQE